MLNGGHDVEDRQPPGVVDGEGARLGALLEERFTLSMEAPDRFVRHYEADISRACQEMAHRFIDGGRLLVFGSGAQATDARHVAVEFVHPVLVGKSALPALALTDDAARSEASAWQGSTAGRFAQPLGLLGRSHDIAMGISAGSGRELADALGQARAMGMLTVALTGLPESGAAAPDADFAFAVGERDILVVQEVHEMLYHILWELVHVFLGARTVTS